MRVSYNGSCFFFGSFFVQINKECYFNVSQKRNRALMQAIHLLFNLSRNIYYNDKKRMLAIIKFLTK